MIHWFVLGTDSLKREASDTGVPFVGPEAEHVAHVFGPTQSSRSCPKKEVEAFLETCRSVEDDASLDQVTDFRIIGDEHHRPGLFFGAEPS